MERKLSFNEAINEIINKKLCSCNCNPCQCSEQAKDAYFQKIKDTLARFNKEYFILNGMTNDFRHISM